MMIVAAAALALGVLVFTLLVRTKDLPEPEPVSPVKHLEDRKATIYENLRDLQFEYRLGKLSDQDYQQTKKALQRELAAVMAEIDAVLGAAPPAPKVLAPEKAAAVPRAGNGGKPAAAQVCPHCGAKFPTALKFCGECGRPMVAEARK
jgi:hypothetical protein